MKKLFLLLTIVLLSSCKRNCEDPKALNYEWKLFAIKDATECKFSKGIFYVTHTPNYPPLSLYIDGHYVDDITLVYPVAPGNCSATGCATYQFVNGDSVDWEVRDAIGNVVNGTLEPSSSSSCLMVKVF